MLMASQPPLPYQAGTSEVIQSRSFHQIMFALILQLAIKSEMH